MDINNNQQVNTFVKGMNTDVSDALMDSSQYRYAENVRLVTNTDSNSGELRLVDGTVFISTHDDWVSILAMTAIRDMVVVIAETKDRTISIYTNIYTNGSFTTDWKCIVRNLPYDEYVQDEEEKPHFSLTARWESENNIKLYIADGIHNLICLNVANDYTNQYRDNITQDILEYATAELDAPTIELTTGGALKSAKIQYGFRLYNVGQPATQISPLSKLTPLYKDNNKGYEPEEITTRAAIISVPYRDTTFSRMQIYRITYVVLGQEPTINLVYDGPIINKYTDRGGSIEQLGVQEFVSLMQLQIVPKVIESKNDYLFAANLKYKQDEYDKELESLDFRSYSYGDWDDVADAQNKDYSKARKYNAQYEVKDTYGKYEYNSNYWKASSDQLGGFGPIVQWQFISQEVSMDENNNATRIYRMDGEYSDYIAREEEVTGSLQSLRRGEVYRYGIVLYSKGGTKSSVKWIADIMAPDDDQYIAYPSGYKRVGLGTNLFGWVFQVLGIKFTIYTTKLENCSGFEIVRCKRTYQDSFTVSQGIIGIPERTYKNGSDGLGWDEKTEIIHPNAFFTTQKLNTRYSKPDNKYLMFASPEYAYQPDDIQDVIKYNKSNLYLKDVQSFYHPKSWLGSITIEHSDGQSSDIDGIYRLGDVYEGGGITKFSNQYGRIIYNNSAGVDLNLNQRISFNDTDDDSKRFCLNSRNTATTETAINNVAAINSKDIPLEVVKINAFGFPEVPAPDKFIDETGAGLFRDNIVTVGSSIFNSWSAGVLFASQSTIDKDMYDMYKQETREHSSLMWDLAYAAYSTVGKCAVFELENEHSIYTDSDVLVPITVSNLTKHAVPYNGPESHDSNSPDYFSQGYYKAIDQPHESYQVYSIDVYDGDCHPGVFVYHAAHCFDNSVLISANKEVTIYYVPVESDVDLRATFGDLYTRKQNDYRSFYIQDTACAIDGYVQDKRAYLFNTAYNSESDIVSYSEMEYTNVDSSKYDYRVHHSELKTNNEHIDRWTEFKALNYLDVDTRFGEITDLRLFKDKLLYWQNNAVGIFSVNERTVVNDDDSNKIILGTGDVLQRYDYISTIYGMKRNQYEAEVQSNTTQYWWDGNNKEILAYAGGTELLPLTKVKDAQNYINSYDEVEHPSLTYDIKFNELISSVVNNGSLIYNEQVKQFTSIYTFNPIFRASVNNDLLLSAEKEIYKWNNHSDESTLFDAAALPLLRYVTNNNSTYTKVFDITTFGGRFYGGDDLSNLTFTFDTPLKQHSQGSGNDLITNREYDFRLDIPRNNNSSYGDRMRGKTMQCELKSSSNSTDFSLQYIITKYRMSWS